MSDENTKIFRDQDGNLKEIKPADLGKKRLTAEEMKALFRGMVEKGKAKAQQQVVEPSDEAAAEAKKHEDAKAFRREGENLTEIKPGEDGGMRGRR